MKCYFTYDPNTLKKVLIPMCYGSLHQEDKSKCHCPDPLTEHQFQKERFNKVLAEKNASIAALESELAHLRKIIENYKTNNHL